MEWCRAWFFGRVVLWDRQTDNELFFCASMVDGMVEGRAVAIKMYYLSTRSRCVYHQDQDVSIIKIKMYVSIKIKRCAVGEKFDVK